VVVAKAGFPEMAISAAYAGPLFNMAFGLGAALTIWNASNYPQSFVVSSPSSVTTNSFLFLVLSLIVSLIGVGASGFIIRRPVSFALIVLFLIATTFGLLAEFGIIHYPLVNDTAKPE